MYRTIDAGKVIATLETLERRIAERFPEANLGRLCAELTQVARETARRVADAQRPAFWLRSLTAAVALGGAALLVYVGSLIEIKREALDVSNVLQGIEAAVNIVVLTGVAIIFLATIESRLARRRALGDLHELRSIVHVIDMHQLTKDPSSLGGAPTSSSPRRPLSAFELSRYLDYCSEMLSLTGKLAALNAQNSKEPTVISAASDISQVAANLSTKIWQKITLVHDRRAFPADQSGSVSM